MRNPVINCLLPILLACACSANAATLTLKECLDKADQGNPALRAAAWDSRIAEENVRLADSGRYPRIDAQAGYTMQLEPQAVIISGRTAETQEPDYAFGGLAANYTIYDFGRRDARHRLARSQADATASQFEARRKDVTMQVIETYFGILEAGHLVTAAREEVTQLEEHRRVAQALFEEGVVTRNDVLQADVRLATARQKLLALDNSRENGWLRLNYLTSSDAAFRGALDEQETVSGTAALNISDSEALARRPEISSLRQSIAASDAEVEESQSNFLPELYTRLALDYVQNDKVREQAIMSATIGLKVNLFDGFASSASREKAIRARSRSLDTLRQAEAGIRLEIATARNDLKVAGERINVAESAIRQSEENLRINNERYRERVGTATEVLDAQTLLTQARSDRYRALFDRQVAAARLKRATGEL